MGFEWGCFIGVTILLSLCGILNSQYTQHTCDIPSLYTKSPSMSERYLVLGTNDNPNAGLGNFLVFFPAMYYYSVFSDRQIVIYDHSLLGRFCSVIHCGFPLVSQMQQLQPEIFTHFNIFHQRILSAKDFREIFNRQQAFHDNEILMTSTGVDSKTEWWMNFPELTRCAARVSGCTIGDLSCAERHAFQTLVLGPFQSTFSSFLSSNLIEFQDNSPHASHKTFKHSNAIVQTLPHKLAPRFDIAVHIRSQLKTFEGTDYNQKRDADPFPIDHNNHSALVKEAQEWMLTEDSQEFMQLLVQNLKQFLLQTQNRKSSLLSDKFRDHDATDQSAEPQDFHYNYTIYLSADNNVVKQLCLDSLKAQLALARFPGTIHFITLNPALSITHVKHLQHHNEGITNKNNSRNDKNNNKRDDSQSIESFASFALPVLDWYALSLSNILISYRTAAKGLSTFVGSSAKVSGSRRRTSFDPSQPFSVGTEAFHVQRNRRGKLFLARISYLPNFDLPTEI